MRFLPAAMRVRIGDPTLVEDLVRCLRRRDYLAVRVDADELEIVPINSVSERGDRARIRRDLAAWQSEHPGVEIEAGSSKG
jgi:hypothetical protein